MMSHLGNMMMASENSTTSQEKWDEFLEDDFKLTKSAERKAHFSNGGTAKSWKRSSKVIDESGSKARKNKQACRKWDQDDE